jgi:hypothetical protein
MGIMKQIDIAKKNLGFKEKHGNVIDASTPFGAAIEKAGHKDGEAWCCYAQEAVFCEAYPELDAKLRKLFSANCFETYCNFLKAGYKVLNYPVEGTLVIWQHVDDGRQTTKGHAGCVSRVISKTQFSSFEGNTSEAGSREGTTFREQVGRDTLRRENGLQVLGFIVIA